MLTQKLSVNTEAPQEISLDLRRYARGLYIVQVVGRHGAYFHRTYALARKGSPLQGHFCSKNDVLLPNGSPFGTA